MKLLKFLSAFAFGAFLLISCADNPVEQQQDGTAQFVLHLHDKPLPANAEALYLDIEEISIHKAEMNESDSESENDESMDENMNGSEDGGWITLMDKDTTINFLELVNGKTAVITDTSLETGKYTQLRLLLNDGEGHGNKIVIDGEEHELFIPSGAQSGVKLNLDLTLNPDELIEVFVDFNAARSVHYAPGRGWMMRPVFHTNTKDVSATISGIVEDTEGEPVQNATVMAFLDPDTTTTLTDENGEYTMRLRAATYDSLTAYIESETITLPDVKYTDVEIEAGDELTGYDFTPEAAESDEGMGKVIMHFFDSPLPENVDSLNIHVKQISVFKDTSDDAGEDDEMGMGMDMSDDEGEWMVVATPDTVINFLDLINGEMTTLVDTSLETGYYEQLRLLLGDNNYVVLDDESRYDLFVPSGIQTGVKINLDFAIEPNEIIEVYVDLNATKSVHYNRGRGWMMRPTFNAFKKVISGTVAGSVTDTAGTALEDAYVFAAAGEDTVASTKTGTEGDYLLVLPEGTYTLTSSADGYSQADTTYEDVMIMPEQKLTEYDFELIPDEEDSEDDSGDDSGN